MIAQFPIRTCRKSGISDKRCFCSVFKNPEIHRGILFRGLAVTSNFYLCMQHTEAIQISLQISRKRLGLCKEAIPYWENIQNFFFLKTFLHFNQSLRRSESSWSIGHLNIKEDLQHRWSKLHTVFVSTLASMGWIRKWKKTQTDNPLWSCKSGSVSIILFPPEVVCSKIPSVVTMGCKTLKCFCWEGQAAELFSMSHDFILNV